MTMCHCGKPLHYTVPTIERMMKELVERRGEYITVEIENRRWRVPRHYIALHGLQASQIDKLGFTEIRDEI